MRLLLLSFLLLAAVRLNAESGNTSIRFAGVPADGGQNCSLCHSSFGAPNFDARGSLTVDVSDYNPGLPQTVHVTVNHPSAMRWGFQMTVRLVTDETQEAGVFTPVDTQVQVRCDDGSRFGAPAPCNGIREFAEHTLAPRTAAGQGFTFDVQWNPPANEAGDVKIYAAAVAADGDGLPAGDRVYTTVKRLSSTGACTLTQRPTLRTAVNGASFQPAFSSNALLSVFGSGFQVPGRSRLAGAGDILNGQFPAQLACVAVEVNGQRVPISYVQQDQINVQAPSFSGSGPVSLVVVLNPGRPNELRSDIATLTAQQAFAPAFFTHEGGNDVVAQVFGSTVAAPPQPGDIVTLYGTGFGATNPAVAAGQLATGIAPAVNAVSVSVGGVALAASDILYAGLSPGSISGLYQLNLRLPTNLGNGALPVIASIGGFQSPPGAVILVQSR